MEPAQAPPVLNSVDPIDEENETNVIEDEVQQEEGDLLEDNIQDRDFTDALLGKKVKALYKTDSSLGISNTSILFSRSAKWHTLIKHLTTEK